MFPAWSMARSTSASGTLFLPRMVRPARNAPNIGCRPSAAVTQALPVASANAIGSELDSTNCPRFIHQDRRGAPRPA